jgi:hypothetical protein
MHKPSIRLAAAAALLLSTFGAQACEIWRDKDFGFWRGNCDLEKFKVSQSFIANYDHRIMLRLPDLHIRKFKYFVVGSSVEIQADVENLGLANAVASTLVVDVSIGNPLNGMQYGSSQQFTVQVPALPLNTSQRVNVATINVPNTTQDWDLILFGVTDPPLTAQQTRGPIAESDETNNSKSDTCRWYGPNPDTSVGPCN